MRLVVEDEAETAGEERIHELEVAIAAKERQLALLSAVAVRAHAARHPGEVLDIALEEIQARLGVTAAWVLMGREADRKLEFAAARGVSSAYLEEVSHRGLGDCLCPEVFETGHRMEARNTTQCPRMPMIVAGLAEPVTHACIPLRFESGESRGVLNVAALPGQRFNDDELRFLETLGHQICVAVERTRHLEAAQRAYDELRDAQERQLQTQKMVTLGTFAAGLAHEIKNPLNSIGLHLSILERRMGRLSGPSGGQLEEPVGVIRGEIARLDALVNDFLLFSKANRLQYRQASLEELADQVTRLLRPEARQANVTLRRRSATPEPIPLLSMDAEKMTQVILNLVRNAIEALPSEGLVVVETGVADGRAFVSVQDDGPGLPSGMDVFQLFVTTKPRGTGLGLSIAQQIVTEHGGEIVVTSEPGAGATFTTFLPLSAGPREEVR
jgi:signal transduction histidine kinase